MNKSIKIILRIIKYLFIVLFVALLCVYLLLNIYVNKKATKVDPEIIGSESTVELTDEQIYIVSYLFSKGKYNKFQKRPLIMDTFSFRNNVALIMAEMICNDVSKSMTEWRFSVLGTKRYIEKKVDYRVCCNYICSKTYFGNGVYGLNDASVFYYDKECKDLTEMEFTKIILMGTNPSYYNVLEHEKRTEEGALEILSQIKDLAN